MTSLRSVGTMLLVGGWLGGLSGCSSALMNAPVYKTADGWKISLDQLKEGPDEYIGEGAINLRPGTGEKYLWAVVTVRNEGAEERDFAYDTCLLGDKTQATKPVVVDRHAGEVHAPVDLSEPFATGQERTRELVYRYPQDLRPTRLKCGTIVLPIPATR